MRILRMLPHLLKCKFRFSRDRFRKVFIDVYWKYHIGSYSMILSWLMTVHIYIYRCKIGTPVLTSNYGISLKGNSAMQRFKLQPKTNRSFQQNGSRPIEFV